MLQINKISAIYFTDIPIGNKIYTIGIKSECTYKYLRYDEKRTGAVSSCNYSLLGFFTTSRGLSLSFFRYGTAPWGLGARHHHTK